VARSSARTKLGVLIVDSDPEARSAYRILFGCDSVTLVDTLAAANAAVAMAGFDVVITEWMLSDGCAERLLDRLGGKGQGLVRLVHASPPLEDFGRAARVAEGVFEKPAWFELARRAGILGPTSQVVAERRIMRRVALRFDVFLRYSGWHSPRRLCTANLSKHGLAFRCTEPLAPGEAIQVALALPRGTRLRFTAVVRHSTPLPSENAARWLVGAEIREIDSAQQLQLEELIRGGC
jgi:hypothetical protein